MYINIAFMDFMIRKISIRKYQNSRTPVRTTLRTPVRTQHLCECLYEHAYERLYTNTFLLRTPSGCAHLIAVSQPSRPLTLAQPKTIVVPKAVSEPKIRNTYAIDE